VRVCSVMLLCVVRVCVTGLCARCCDVMRCDATRFVCVCVRGFACCGACVCACVCLCMDAGRRVCMGGWVDLLALGFEVILACVDRSPQQGFVPVRRFCRAAAAVRRTLLQP
jgi:hypothetical protein